MCTFGQRLKKLRNSRHLKQEQLAEKLGIATSTIGSYERDTREPNIETLTKISTFFNVSLDYMFCKTDDPRTVEMAMKENSKDLREFLSNNSVIFNGSEISAKDKNRILDVLLGLFWHNMDEL